MADYIPILDTQIAPDAPLTAALAAQWRDNPIAIAQGAAGAPRIVPAALDRRYALSDVHQISLGWDGVGIIAAVDGHFQGVIHTPSLPWAYYGTYAILYNNNAHVIQHNVVVPGSQLRRGLGLDTTVVLSSTSAVNFGSWRAMMDVPGVQGDQLAPGLFLRVS